MADVRWYVRDWEMCACVLNCTVFCFLFSFGHCLVFFSLVCKFIELTADIRGRVLGR